MVAQKFGGPWSLVKLEAVTKYLTAFNIALKHQPFSKIYIDAFAGSGTFTFAEEEAAPLFDQKIATTIHLGSARRAIEIKPQFDRLIFIENDPNNVASLKSAAASYPGSLIDVIQGDANHHVQEICKNTNWSKTRGVIFLDPFGNSVEWKTIEALGKTNLDVWYLFPLSGIYRNAPIDALALTSDKEATLTQLLGTSIWRDRFYTNQKEDEKSLFSLPLIGKRTSNVDDIQAFVQERLAGVFPLVLPPRTLLGPSRAPMFSLFFAMANKSEKAQKVATPIAKYILRGW